MGPWNVMSQRLLLSVRLRQRHLANPIFGLHPYSRVLPEIRAGVHTLACEHRSTGYLHDKFIDF
jgi:hypothetical protein